MPRLINLPLIALLCLPLSVKAQTSPELRQILERLERLERENRALADEVHALRAELSASRVPPPAAAPVPAEPAAAAETVPAEAPPAGAPERLEIAERRIEEQAQTKVEASQKFPIRLTGMALFNAFANSRANGDSDYPGIAAPNAYRRDGATMRQTVIGLDFRGPETIWGGKIQGSVYMDFYAGTGAALNQVMRLRTGNIEIDWKDRSFMAGLEKPIFNPRDPSSLARVGVSPLTGAGNLWLWVPQAAFEQDLHFGPSTGLRAKVGVIQTQEVGPYNSPNLFTERSRPGLEGRFELFHRFDDNRRFEIAPGFHVSTSHVAGYSVPSNLVSVDWLIVPHRLVEFSGFFYSGQNLAHLGTGGARQGIGMYAGGPDAIPTLGGWGQLTFHAASRVALHLFTGQMDDQNSYLRQGALGKNLVYGGNIFYNLAPNVIVALEATRTNSTYIGTGTLYNNHYDLALAYLF